MRLSIAFAILLALVTGGAETPSTPAPDTWKPDARLFYESDTRAYYRPCG